MKTRVTFVDFEVYSANLDIWLTSRTIFEWLPSGVVIGTTVWWWWWGGFVSRKNPTLAWPSTGRHSESLELVAREAA